MRFLFTAFTTAAQHDTFLRSATRTGLIAWLKWNDPNGDYDEEDGVDAIPTDQLRQLALNQLKAGTE